MKTKTIVILGVGAVTITGLAIYLSKNNSASVNNTKAEDNAVSQAEAIKAAAIAAREPRTITLNTAPGLTPVAPPNNTPTRAIEPSQLISAVQEARANNAVVGGSGAAILSKIQEVINTPAVQQQIAPQIRVSNPVPTNTAPPPVTIVPAKAADVYAVQNAPVLKEATISTPKVIAPTKTLVTAVMPTKEVAMTVQPISYISQRTAKTLMGIDSSLLN